MAHVKITIDGETILDDNLGEWTRALPERLQQELHPNEGRPQPWIRAIGLAMVEAATDNKPFEADVTTSPGEWTLTVKTPV